MGKKTRRRPLKLLLREMDRINHSELSERTHLRKINVFLFPMDEEGKEVDLNGRSPWLDIDSYKTAQEVLLFYFKDKLNVWAALNATCIPQERDEQGFLCTWINKLGKQQIMRVRFWHY